MSERASGGIGLVLQVWRWLKPSFDETTLVVMAVTCLALLAANPQAVDILRIPWEAPGAGILAYGVSMLLLLASLAGVVLVLVNACVRRSKTAVEKYLMAIFVMVANVVAGVFVGLEGMRAGGGTHLILPLLNIAVAFVLFNQVVIIEGGIISDTDASPIDVLVGLAVLGLLLVFCQYNRLSWPVTFSMCIAYSTLAHEAVMGVARSTYALIGGGPVA